MTVPSDERPRASHDPVLRAIGAAAYAILTTAPAFAALWLTLSTDWSGWAMDKRLFDPGWWATRSDRLFWLALFGGTVLLNFAFLDRGLRAYDPDDWEVVRLQREQRQAKLRAEGWGTMALRLARWKERLGDTLMSSLFSLGLGIFLGLLASPRRTLDWLGQLASRGQWDLFALVLLIGGFFALFSLLGLLALVVGGVDCLLRACRARFQTSARMRPECPGAACVWSSAPVPPDQGPSASAGTVPDAQVIADRWLKFYEGGSGADRPGPKPAAASAAQTAGLTTAQLVTLWYAAFLIVAILLLLALFQGSPWHLMVAIVLLAALTVYTQGNHPRARRALAVATGLGLAAGTAAAFVVLLFAR